MENDTVEIKVKGVMPTASGSALFLGPQEKTFVIYIEPAVGHAISMALSGAHKERPMTHDLILNIFKGLSVGLDRIVINHVHEGTFHARMILSMENELGKKIVEMDARPSDCIVLALELKKPILVAQKVLNEVQDMTEVLTRLLDQQNK